MEILNNIWVALSTPNEGLTNILVTIMGLLENALTMHLFLAILNLRANKRKKITYIHSFWFV